MKELTLHRPRARQALDLPATEYPLQELSPRRAPLMFRSAVSIVMLRAARIEHT